MERKKDIRRRILSLRMRQEQEEWTQKTEIITEKIVSCRWFLEAESFFCYADFKGEVGTRGMMEAAWRLGKRVYVPRMAGEVMEFYEVYTFSELKPGTWGIPEPSGEKRADSFGKGLMILPGVAFDRKGNRVGYGKGCYDRYLALHPEIRTIGAAFELQLTDEIEVEKTDIHVDALVTEKGMYEL